MSAASSVALPLLWFALAFPFLFKAVPQWREALGLFVTSLGEADPWNWPAFGRAAAGHLAAAAGLAAIVAAAFWAGGPLPGWLALPAAAARRRAFRLVSGFGVVALVQQGLGLAGLWTPPLLRVLIGVLVAGGAVAALRHRPWSGWHVPAADARAPLAAAALLAVAAFALARLPDTHDDPRTYHFAAPEAYLQVHKIHAEPLNVNWHMPFAAEMNFALGWVAGDIEGAKLLNVGFLVALVLVTLLLAGRLAPGGSAPAWSAGWLLTAGLVSEECWQGKDDLLLTLNVAAAAWCAAEAVAGRGRRWWLGAAWCLGLAAGVKFTAGFFVAALAVAAVMSARRPRFRTWPLLVALAVLPVAGWLLMSWLFLGDPVHPFLSGIFPDLGWGPRYRKALSDVMLAMSPAEARRWSDLVFAPWRSWGDPRLGSIALMTLAPLGLLLVRGPAAGLLRWTVLGAYVLWLPTERNARYLFPAVPLLAAFAAAAAAPAARGNRAARWGIHALLAASVATALLTAGLHLVPAGWQRVTGLMGRPAFLDRQFTTWDRVRRRINADLPAGSRILFTGEERRLWFRPRVRSYFTVHEPVFWAMTRDSFNPPEMRKRVRQMGLTHQLHNFVSGEYRALTRHPGPPWSDRQIALYREFTRRYSRPVMAPDRIDYANGGFWVFAFDRAPAPRPWPVHFLPLTEGAFYPAYRLHSAHRDQEALREAQLQAARLAGVGEAQLILGKIHASLGDNAELYRILHRVIPTGFIGDASFKHLGGAALNEGHLAEGLAAYLAEWRETRNPDLKVGIAYAFYRMAREKRGREAYASALRDLDVAVRLVPDQPAVLFEYAQALERAGRRSEAAAPALRAMRLAPEDTAIRDFVAGLGVAPF
ncbi:MAG: glycosyltransferase family 39 protein [Candidatus Coatesbacteria bacterium]